MSGTTLTYPVPVIQPKPPPAIRAHTLALSGVPATSIVGAKPGGTTEGDLLFAFYAAEDNTSVITPPPGWTTVFDHPAGGSASIELHGYYKVAGAGEPAGYTWLNDLSKYLLVGIIRIDGHDAAAPVDVHAENDSAATSSYVCPSVTATKPFGLLLSAVATNKDTLVTPDASTTELFDQSQAQSSLFCAHEDLASAGATGTRTHTAIFARAVEASVVINVG